MNIVYSCSDLYSELAGISLTSLLINNMDTDIINIIIMDNGISDDNKTKLIKTAQKFNRNISFVPLAESLDGIRINLQKWNISTFGRLFEASSLSDYDKVIHIDCDTIVDGSIRDVWELDMSNHIVAGASDCLSDAYKTNIGMKPEDSYINAGFIMLNLKRIRDLQIEDTFLAYINKNSHMLTYVDQEVLNACIPEKEKLIIPLKYNSYSILHYLSYKQLLKLRYAKHFVPEGQFYEAKNNPVVIHFTGCFLEGTRPWIEKDKHPKRDLFLKYKNESLWNDCTEWDDNRKINQKITTVIAKITPRILLTSFIGLIHGVIIPNRNKKKQKG